MGPHTGLRPQGLKSFQTPLKPWERGWEKAPSVHHLLCKQEGLSLEALHPPNKRATYD